MLQHASEMTSVPGGPTRVINTRAGEKTTRQKSGMGVEGLLGTEEERSARPLIERASAMLSGGIPPGFVVRLFDHAVPEDLLDYAPEELAALAEAAWDFLAIRKPGQPKIRFVTPPAGERLKAVSIIE